MSRMVHINWDPDVETLRNFGFVALGGFGLVAVLAWFEWLVFAVGLGAARPYVAAGAVLLGTVAALLSLVAPRANRPLYVGLSVVAYPIGFVLSHLLLGALFFGLFAPIGVVFRLIGRDPLRRRYEPGAASYWTLARAPRDPERYFRQF